MAASWPTSTATDATLYIAVNLLQTTLANTINNSVTTIQLGSTTNFPTAGAVTIDNEVIFYTGVSGANLTGCVRGSDSTTAASHNANVPVGATIVAFHHNGLKDEIKALESDLQTRIGFANGNNQVLLASASNTAPSLSIGGTGTGIYSSGANAIDIATNGVRQWTFDSSGNFANHGGGQVLSADGSVGSPSHSFSGATTSGLYKIGTNDIGFATNGVIGWEVNATQQFILPKTTNQLIFGTTNTVTISSTAPSASRTYTLPDAGGAANLLLDAGNYTLTGTWTNATLITPALGTPASGSLTNCTNLPVVAGTTGTLTVARGGTGTTTSTGTGSVMLNSGPTLSAGSSNDTDYTLETLTGGSQTTLFKSYTTTGVTTSAKTIAASTSQNGCMIMVAGNNGSGYFFDILVTGDNGGSPTPFSSNTTLGSPATRTYTKSGGALQLTMGSGTYSVHTFIVSLG